MRNVLYNTNRTNGLLWVFASQSVHLKTFLPTSSPLEPLLITMHYSCHHCIQASSYTLFKAPYPLSHPSCVSKASQSALNAPCTFLPLLSQTSSLLPFLSPPYFSLSLLTPLSSTFCALSSSLIKPRFVRMHHQKSFHSWLH